jgi:hypothetical protein
MAFARYADAPLYYETSVCTAVLAGEEKDLDIIMVHVVTQPVWSADGRGVGMTGLAWVTIDTMLPCDIMIAGTQELASLIRPGDSLVLLDVKLAGEHVDRTKIETITAYPSTQVRGTMYPLRSTPLDGLSKRRMIWSISCFETLPRL